MKHIKDFITLAVDPGAMEAEKKTVEAQVTYSTEIYPCPYVGCGGNTARVERRIFPRSTQIKKECNRCGGFIANSTTPGGFETA